MAVTAEAPITLTDAQPRSLGLTDQLGLWANLGISLLIPVTAVFLVAPGQSFLATVVAIVAGTTVGCLLLAAVARAGAVTGAPTMVLLRGLLGRSGSYVPTVLNLLQCVGWATYEIWVISFAAHRGLGRPAPLGVRPGRRCRGHPDGAAAAGVGAAAQADRRRRGAGLLGVLPGGDAAPAPSATSPTAAGPDSGPRWTW